MKRRGFFKLLGAAAAAPVVAKAAEREPAFTESDYLFVDGDGARLEPGGLLAWMPTEPPPHLSIDEKIEWMYGPSLSTRLSEVQTLIDLEIITDANEARKLLGL